MDVRSLGLDFMLEVLGQSCFSVWDCELVDNIKVAHHHGELLEADLAIEVSVGLDDRAVDQLLELLVVQVVADHHFEDFEEFTIWNVAVVVDVVDLERKLKFVLLGSASGERVQTLHELQKWDVSVVVTIEHSDNSLDERVVLQLWDLKELGWLECATLISVDLAEVLVELLEFFLAEVQVLELLLLLSKLVSHLF